MNVVVNGLMTGYDKTGKGKVLVFIAGWGDSSATYTQLVGLLKDKFTIYTIDLPGFGGTQAPPQAWGLEDYADFLEAWLVKLDIKPLAIAGHSYGGAVAAWAVSRKPLSQKLILLASAGIRNKNPLKKTLLSAAAKTGKLPLLALPPNKRRAVKTKFYKSIGSDLMLLPHMEQTFRRIISQDVRERVRSISVPTLLIFGARDKATPVSDGRILNGAIKNSKFEIIEAGHFLHQERPDEVAALITAFLERKSPNA